MGSNEHRPVPDPVGKIVTVKTKEGGGITVRYVYQLQRLFVSPERGAVLLSAADTRRLIAKLEKALKWFPKKTRRRTFHLVSSFHVLSAIYSLQQVV